uniref:MMS1_N domain-containing protein n=1 Tax=Schistocephalus solidus TaxID=70667 RepID=A0A183TQF1_SCHSO
LPFRQGFIALCEESLKSFDHQGSFVSDITLSGIVHPSILTHLAVVVTDTWYVLVANRHFDGLSENSSISLHGIDGTHHSSYAMPKGAQVTAMCPSESKFGKVNETEVLTVVGSSDGVIRFLLFDLRTPSKLVRWFSV